MSHWQDGIALVLVAAALAAFVWHFARGFLRKENGGCNGCCGCATTPRRPELIALDPAEKAPNRAGPVE